MSKGRGIGLEVRNLLIQRTLPRDAGESSFRDSEQGQVKARGDGDGPQLRGGLLLTFPPRSA